MYDLNGKIAIVTGAGGRHGIGRAIATRLSLRGRQRRGHRRSPEPERHPRRGPPAGLGGPEQRGRRDRGHGPRVAGPVLRRVGQRPGRRHGGTARSPGSGASTSWSTTPAPARGKTVSWLSSWEEEAFDEVMRVNVRGTYLVSRAVARPHDCPGRRWQDNQHLVGRRQAGHRPLRCVLRLQVRHRRLHAGPWRRRWPSTGSTSTPSAPAWWTPRRVDFIAAALAPAGESSEEYRAGMIADRAVRVPMGRVAEGNDIARMAAFLSSAESDYVTGLSISVSGGSEMN